MPDEPYKSPFNLPDEHMRLVGIIAFHWEALDLSMQRAVAEVTMHEFHRVSLLTDNINFRTKLDLLLAYARPLEAGDPELWREFTTAVQAIRDANVKRNAFVHAKWKRGATPDIPKRVVARVQGGRLNIFDEPTPRTELEEAAQFIYAAGERLTLLFQKCGMMLS